MTIGNAISAGDNANSSVQIPLVSLVDVFEDATDYTDLFKKTMAGTYSFRDVTGWTDLLKETTIWTDFFGV